MKSQYDYITPGEVEPESLKNFEPGEYEIVANFPSRIATVSEGVQWLVSFFSKRNMLTFAKILPIALIMNVITSDFFIGTPLRAFLEGRYGSCVLSVLADLLLCLLFQIMIWLYIVRSEIIVKIPVRDYLTHALRVFKEKASSVAVLFSAHVVIYALIVFSTCLLIYLLVPRNEIDIFMDSGEYYLHKFDDLISIDFSDRRDAQRILTLWLREFDAVKIAPLFKVSLIGSFTAIIGGFLYYMLTIYALPLVIFSRVGVIRALVESFKGFSKNVLSLTVAGLLVVVIDSCVSACFSAMPFSDIIISTLTIPFNIFIFYLSAKTIFWHGNLESFSSQQKINHETMSGNQNSH